jgi:chorismate mutase
VPVRALRGAVQVDADDRELVLAAVAELLTEVMRRNDLTADDMISVLFTATPDLRCEFPAVAARQLGITDVPLLCTVEIDVVGAMPRVLRLMAHVETPRARSELRHVYLRGSRWSDRRRRHRPDRYVDSPRPARRRPPGAAGRP